MKSIIIVTTIACLFFSSCDNNSHADIDNSLPVTTVNRNNPDSSSTIKESVSETVNLPGGGLNQGETGVQQAPAEVYQAAGLNPPHGQPGHDCAVAVGAPLTGGAAPKNLPSVAAPTMSFPSSTPAPVPAATSGSQKLNPPHGQPGHDCAVQVGAPLG